MPLGEEYWWSAKKQIPALTGRSILIPNNTTLLARTNVAGVPATDVTRMGYSNWFRNTDPGSTICCMFGGGSGNMHCVQLNPANGTISDFKGNVGVVWAVKPDSFDPSEWCHVLVTWDGNLAAIDRWKIWVNGVLLTEWTTAPTSANNDCNWNVAGGIANVGRFPANVYGWRGYLHYCVLVDGRIPTADEFGYFDGNGKWMPKQYLGSVGAKGFILDFADDLNLGKDLAGNGDFTLTGISTTNIYDDKPQITYPLMLREGAFVTSVVAYTIDRLGVGLSSGTVNTCVADHLIRAGKFYWEVKCAIASANVNLLVGACAAVPSKTPIVGLRGDGQFFDGSGFSAYRSAWLANEFIGVELDGDAKTIRFTSGTGAWGPLKPLDPNVPLWQPVLRPSTATTDLVINFGQLPWGNPSAKPSDTKVLSAATQESYVDPRLYVGKLLYTGNGGAQGVGGLAFTPDLVWIKHRKAAEATMVFNAVRGVGRHLLMNSTAGEVVDATTLTGFSAGGIALGASLLTNKAGDDYIAYCFKKSLAAGMDIVTWAGDGTAARVIPHALGKVPKVIIVKRIDAVAALWPVYDAALANNAYIALNTAVAAVTDATVFPSGTAPPTAANFTVGSHLAVNAVGGTYVAFVFTDILGVSRFDSFTGTAASYSFALGFRSSFSVARGFGAQNWKMWDNRRLDVGGANFAHNLDGAAVEASDANAYSVASGVRTHSLAATTWLAWSWAARLHRNTRATPPGN